MKDRQEEESSRGIDLGCSDREMRQMDGKRPRDSRIGGNHCYSNSSI